MGLGRIGPDAEAAVPDLILLLGDKSERIRRRSLARARADRHGRGRALDRRVRAPGRHRPRGGGRGPGDSVRAGRPGPSGRPRARARCRPGGPGGGGAGRWRGSSCPMRPCCRSSRRTSGTRTSTSGWRWSICSSAAGRCSLALAPELESPLDGGARRGLRATPRSCSARSARTPPRDCSTPSATRGAASIRSPRHWPRSAGRPSGCSRRRSKPPSLASDEARPWPWDRSVRWPRVPCRS